LFHPAFFCFISHAARFKSRTAVQMHWRKSNEVSKTKSHPVCIRSCDYVVCWYGQRGFGIHGYVRRLKKWCLSPSRARLLVRGSDFSVNLTPNANSDLSVTAKDKSGGTDAFANWTSLGDWVNGETVSWCSPLAGI
jgi:hypothetical protein